MSAVKHHILQHLPVFQYNVGGVRARCPARPQRCAPADSACGAALRVLASETVEEQLMTRERPLL